ncbi:MAG: sortase [Eubacteriales bacterium]|jgi:sortase A
MNKRQGIFFITLGLLLIAAALALFIYNRVQERTAGEISEKAVSQLREVISANAKAFEKYKTTYDIITQTLQEPQTPQEPDSPEEQPDDEELPPSEYFVPDYQLNPEMDMPGVVLDGSRYIGILDIPSLWLSLPIMGDWNDRNLKLAPCRYSGTVYQDDLVISGHNYKTHFGRLNRISIGDRITFTDIDGNVFEFEVAEVEVLEATAIEDMISSDWQLTLFTCTYDGTTRFTVRCTRIEN